MPLAFEFGAVEHGGHFVKLRALFPVNLEPEYSRDVSDRFFLGDEVGVGHEQDVGERAAEVRPVDIGALFLGKVNVLALWAEYLDSGVPEVLRHADRQDLLSAAQNPGAHPEYSVEELLPHHGESLGGLEEPAVDEPVKVDRLLVHVQEPDELAFGFRGRRRRGSPGRGPCLARRL